MTAGFKPMQQHSNCCATFAAASASARFAVILDTVIMAVSIFVLLLGRLLIMPS